MIWRPCDLNLVMISSLASKFQHLGCPFFSHFMIWNWRPLISKSWHFAASDDIMTKSKSQGLHIIRIKYWNASRSGSPPSLISAYWNIGISFHKMAKLWKYMQHSVCYRCQSTFQICLFFCRKNKITQIQIVPDIATRCPPQIGFCFPVFIWHLSLFCQQFGWFLT